MELAEPFFHPEAKAEYASAMRWYEERSERAAFRFEQEVERVLATINSDPELFPRYDVAHRFAILERLPYSLVYEVNSLGVQIVAVAHASRRPDYWRDRS